MSNLALTNLNDLQRLRGCLPDLEAEIRRRRRYKLNSYYPATGPLRRELYQKHLEFFRAGKEHRERLVLAANRIGKTEGMGAYETTLHLTGLYPPWWEGRRFLHAGEFFACNATWSDVRDINQAVLIGPPQRPEEWGTGMIPGNLVRKYIPNPHVKDGLMGVLVRHVSGGISDLQFKGYEQGYEAFRGRNKHGIWLDEECEEDIYTECLMRTMTTHGIIYATFTPLQGRTKLINSFLSQAVNRHELELN